MPAKRFKLSSLAMQHLAKINNYTIENFSAQQWEKYKAMLLSGFQMLADNPDLGRSCEAIYPDGFYFYLGKHTAYYMKKENFILVVAVLSQTQLPQKHLKKQAKVTD